MTRQVVVTGMAVVSPLESGDGLEMFWKELLAGKCAIKEVKSFDTGRYECKIAGEVKGFEHTGTERWINFLDFAFKEALADAGVDAGAGGFGLYIGTVLGGILAGQKAWKENKPTLPEEYHLYSGERYLTDNYKIKGPVLTVSTACASGTDALGMAYRNILWGKADVMVAGGADTLSEFAFCGFNNLKALTKTKVRPFDKNRDGLALGEGAAFLVLEEADAAKKRGARIYGRITGYASRADAHHMTGPDKEGRGLASAIKAALKEAGISKPDYINAHGTGTIYNDAMETKAIKLAFGNPAYEIPVSSIKSMIGHSFGAGGAIEAAACLLAIKNGAIPPTINYQEKDPECDLDYVPNTARKADIKTAISLSAGFGGQNAALLFSATD
ncbi:MAG: beta-ketoacyl-[acyl-carrier-protein] synthase family protein [Deltaproteobacteria bacterium]